MKRKQQDFFSTAHLHDDLKWHAVRSGRATFTAQITSFFLNLTSLMILARLLAPADFGLVAMVTALTGVIAMFKDAGLSMATVQRETVIHEQVSNLFWINVGLSMLLAMVIMALAPAIAFFYNEPRLNEVAMAVAAIFLLGGLSVQHRALLRRQMRFETLARIQIGATTVGLLAAIGVAMLGVGYWALIVQMAITELVSLLLTWGYSQWVPGRPKRRVGTQSMLKFGGYLTSFNFVNYFARNADNILIGHAWGSQALGLYARAYSLLVLPIMQINGPITAVATSVLSRLQDRPEEFRDFFRKILGLVTLLSFPLIAFMIICREEIVIIVLGPQWREAIPIYTALALSAFFQPIGNLCGILYTTLGRTKRMFKWGVMGTVWLIIAFIVGLPYGPLGVAIAYAIAVALMMLPMMMFSISGTFMRLEDYFEGMKIPTIATLISGALGMSAHFIVTDLHNQWISLLVVAFTIATSYFLLIMLMQPGLLIWFKSILISKQAYP